MQTTPQQFWFIRDANADKYDRHGREYNATYVLCDGRKSYLPGFCDECGDTMIDFASRDMDTHTGTCARCEGDGAAIMFSETNSKGRVAMVVAWALFGGAHATAPLADLDREQRHWNSEYCPDECDYCRSLAVR